MSPQYDHNAFFAKVYENWDRAQSRPWEKALKPVRLSKNCWFIGEEWIGVILISTDDGLVLIDSGMPGQTYLIFEDIRKLGFSPEDIKLVLISHGHFDHCGALKAIVEYSGAKVCAPAADLDAIEGRSTEDIHQRYLTYLPVEADFIYDYSKPIIHGGIEIQPMHTPGHTPGCTTFFIKDVWIDDTPITVGVLSGLGLNGSIPDNGDMELEPYRTNRNTYRASLELLAKQKVDVTAALHPQSVTNQPIEKDGEMIAVNNTLVWTRTVEKYLQRLNIAETQTPGK